MIRTCADQKELIGNNFTRHALHYDRYSCVQDLVSRDLIAMVPRRDFRYILDLGCGTGTYTLQLAGTFAGSAITAVDISAAMVDVAMRKCAGHAISFVVDDAEHFTSEKKYDLITSNATFQWMTDLEPSLECYRKMLSDDGMILFSTFGPTTFSELSSSLRAVAGPEVAISAGSFLTKDALTMMMKARFRESAVEERAIKREYGSLSELLGHIKYTGTRGRGVGALMPGNRNLFDRIERAYRERFGAIVASYQIFFCRGSR